MADEANEPDSRPMDTEERELSDRRDFLRSMGKWSTAAIAAILLSEPAPSHAASGRVNSRGSWINRGGGGWLNSRGGGGSWVNRRGW